MDRNTNKQGCSPLVVSVWIGTRTRRGIPLLITSVWIETRMRRGNPFSSHRPPLFLETIMSKIGGVVLKPPQSCRKLSKTSGVVLKPPHSCRTILICQNEMPTRRVNPPRRVVYSWVVRNNNKSKRNGGRTMYAHSHPSSLFATSRLRWW